MNIAANFTGRLLRIEVTLRRAWITSSMAAFWGSVIGIASKNALGVGCGTPKIDACLAVESNTGDVTHFQLIVQNARVEAAAASTLALCSCVSEVQSCQTQCHAFVVALHLPLIGRLLREARPCGPQCPGNFSLFLHNVNLQGIPKALLTRPSGALYCGHTYIPLPWKLHVQFSFWALSLAITSESSI